VAGGFFSAKPDNVFVNNKGGYFVFVPLPCPNGDAYKKPANFLDTVVLQASQQHLRGSGFVFAG
jgi:hypothetical protein